MVWADVGGRPPNTDDVVPPMATTAQINYALRVEWYARTYRMHRNAEFLASGPQFNKAIVRSALTGSWCQLSVHRRQRFRIPDYANRDVNPNLFAYPSEGSHNTIGADPIPDVDVFDVFNFGGGLDE